MSTESLTNPKIEEQKLQSMTASVFPSLKKKSVSNLATRQVNSISIPPVKAYDAQKSEVEQYEYNSKGIRVNKSCATPTNKNSIGLKKDHGQYGSEKFIQGKLAKRLSVHKHEQVYL